MFSFLFICLMRQFGARPSAEIGEVCKRYHKSVALWPLSEIYIALCGSVCFLLLLFPPLLSLRLSLSLNLCIVRAHASSSKAWARILSSRLAVRVYLLFMHPMSFDLLDLAAAYILNAVPLMDGWFKGRTYTQTNGANRARAQKASAARRL